MEITPLYHNQRPDGALLPQEEAAFGILEALGIDYDRVSSEPADTMEKCAAVGTALGLPVCKNLFLCNRQKTKFYLLAMVPDKPFHTKDLSKQINSARLSFAPEEQLWELLHCTPGSATVLGLMNDTEHQVQLLMDREIYAARESNTTGISSADLCRNIPGSVYCSTLDKVTEQLSQLARPGDLILTVGAGDIYRAGEKLLEKEN